MTAPPEETFPQFELSDEKPAPSVGSFPKAFPESPASDTSLANTIDFEREETTEFGSGRPEDP